MNFDEACAYLFGLGHETLTLKLGLTNISRLLEQLGSPHKDFLSVQIAGTNGKGSVAAMLASICHAANIKTGLYTSPHLVSITERIRIDETEIETQDFARLATEVRAACERLAAERSGFDALPTFFEQMTAIALLAFSRARVRVAVLETGLGGRLDATTAAGARYACITPVSLDHQQYLGDTLAQIAWEKAAIISAHTRAAVIAPQTDEALRVIAARAAEFGTPLRLVSAERYDARPKRGAHEHAASVIDRYAVHENDGGSESNTDSMDGSDGRIRADFFTSRADYKNVRLSLRGRHQIINAQTAIALAETIDGEADLKIPAHAIVAGLENAKHFGRLELLDTTPPVLLDGAHNEDGARALRAYLDEFVHAHITLIFGAMSDKDLRDIARVLFPAARRVVLTQMDNPRAASVKMLRRVVPPDYPLERVTFATNVGDAWRAARTLTATDEMICVAGSLYLVGEVKVLFKQESDTKHL